MTRRRRTRATGALVLILAAAVVLTVVLLPPVIGPAPAAFLAGNLTGAAAVLAVVRPRLSLRVSTRGTRGRPR